MKKLVLMAAAIVAVSFASCGNKAANAEQATAAAAADTVAVDSAAVVADTVAVDSAAVVAE